MRPRQVSKLAPAPNFPAPPFLGSRVKIDFDMKEVFGFLNDLTLFSTQWQFKKGGVKPAEYERQMREVARPALARLKEYCLTEKILRPAAVYGFFPAASDGDVLTVYQDDRRTPLATFAFPRQDHGEFLCLSDYVAPLKDGTAIDHVAFSAVTMGREVSKIAHDWYEAGKYQDYLYLHGLGVEAAEALAEFIPQANCGPSGASAATMPRTCGSYSRNTTAAAATASATPPAPASKTRQASSNSSTRPASALP